MSSILLKNVIFNHCKKDVLIVENRFSEIADYIEKTAETVLDCQCEKLLIPPFFNAHTHAAMTLLRGYADDFELFKWLSEYIWPMEERLISEDVYNGSRLAILEMIKSGSVFFNDMYWYQDATIRAVEEMGIRACIGMLQLSTKNKETLKKNENEFIWKNRMNYSSRIQLAFAPHAIYTVAKKDLARIADRAMNSESFLHIHISETKKEVADCLAEHGIRPVEYLDSLGILGPRTILAHAIHLNEKEFELVAERGAVLVNMPISNMKLASGAFHYRECLAKGCRMALGTDGVSSNNNLSMFEEMKFAALLAKHEEKNPEIMNAHQVFRLATRGGAEAFGIDSGLIEEGRLADAVLLDMKNSRLVPAYHTDSNLVYSADSSCVDTVICDGRILMKNGFVEGEEEIIAKARESIACLLKK